MSDIDRAPARNHDRSVLIVANNVWNIANFRLHLVEALVSEGYDIVCAADPEDFWPNRNAADQIRATGARYIPLPLDRRGTNPVADMRLAFRLMRVLWRHRPDLVLCYTLKPAVYGVLAAWLLQVPRVPVLTGLGSALTRPRTMVGWISRRLLKTALRRSTCVLVLNEADRTAVANLAGVPVNRVWTIPGEGVDTTRFESDQSLTSDEVTFLFVGRLLRDKGVFEYVEAANGVRAARPGTRFQIGGGLDQGNPTAVDLADLKGWIGDGVIDYLGVTDSPAEWYRSADVVVLPSYREGMSRVLLEAMAAGLPVITTDVPGCRDLVDDGGSGIVCPPMDVSALTSAMIQMADIAPAERHAMGERGRAKITGRYDSRTVIEQYLEGIPAWIEGRCK